MYIGMRKDWNTTGHGGYSDTSNYWAKDHIDQAPHTSFGQSPTQPADPSHLPSQHGYSQFGGGASSRGRGGDRQAKREYGRYNPYGRPKYGADKYGGTGGYGGTGSGYGARGGGAGGWVQNATTVGGGGGGSNVAVSGSGWVQDSTNRGGEGGGWGQESLSRGGGGVGGVGGWNQEGANCGGVGGVGGWGHGNGAERQGGASGYGDPATFVGGGNALQASGSDKLDSYRLILLQYLISSLH